MKALISPNENFRVCQIEVEEFPVAEPLFWVDCDNAITTEWTYVDKKFIKPEILEPTVTPQPTKEELLAQLQALTAKIEAL